MQDETSETLPEIPLYWDLRRRSDTRYRAHDIRNGRSVEIRLIEAQPDHAAADDLDRLVSRLRELGPHPSLVPLLDHGTTADGHRYLVWPESDGPTLADVVPGRSETTDRTAGAAGPTVDGVADLAHGLAALHRAGIAHGDLSPENVVIADDGGLLLGPTLVVAGEPPTDADDVRAFGAVVATALPDLATRPDDPLADLVATMTSAAPGDRPSMDEAARQLDAHRSAPTEEPVPSGQVTQRPILATRARPTEPLPGPATPVGTVAPVAPVEDGQSRRRILAALTVGAAIATAAVVAAFMLTTSNRSTEAAIASTERLDEIGQDGSQEQVAADDGEDPTGETSTAPLAPAAASAAGSAGDETEDPTASQRTTSALISSTKPTSADPETSATSATDDVSTGSSTTLAASTVTSPTSAPTTRRTTASTSPTTEPSTTVAPTTRRTTTTRRPTTTAPRTTAPTTAAPTSRRTTTTARPTTAPPTTARPTTTAVDCTWREPSAYVSNFVVLARADDDLYATTDPTCPANRSIRAGDRFRVIAEQAGWYYGQREASGLYGWAPTSNMTGCRPDGPDSYISNLTLTANRSTGLRARPQSGCILIEPVGSGQSVRVVAEQGIWYYGRLTSGGLWGWIPKSELSG